MEVYLLTSNKSISKKEFKKMDKLIRFFKDEEGATAVEYAIMVALIAIVIIAMVIIVGERANNAFSKTASALNAT